MLDWLHGLTLQINFIVNPSTFIATKNDLLESLIWIDKCLNLSFKCDSISIKFESEITDDMIDNNLWDYSQLFIEAFKIDWYVFIKSIICNNINMFYKIISWIIKEHLCSWLGEWSNQKSGLKFDSL